MHVEPVRPIAGSTNLDVDRCARSGLSAPTAFSTIYSTDISRLREFYVTLLSRDNIKFETTDMVVFELTNGLKLLVQQVSLTSPFAKLKGCQSFGIACENSSGVYAAAVNLGWKDKAGVLDDPDGNTILVAEGNAASKADAKDLIRLIA